MRNAPLLGLLLLSLSACSPKPVCLEYISTPERHCSWWAVPEQVTRARTELAELTAPTPQLTEGGEFTCVGRDASGACIQRMSVTIQ